MARLSRDALLLLANMNAFDTFSIRDIALTVFKGADTERPGQVKAVAMARALNAARCLIALGRAVAVPDRKNMDAIRSTDTTGGSVHAQSIMNFVVRGGLERRSTDERRTEDRTDASQRRRMVRVARREQPVEQEPTRAPSPFDIPKDFAI